MKNSEFNVAIQTKKCIDWIKNWFQNYSNNAKGVVIGISGGKDSAVVAKLCCESLGSEKVFGALMPNGVQSDINDSIELCKALGISYCEINIKDSYDELVSKISDISEDALINIAPRLRMATLYAIAQSKNYRVAGTGNLSEGYIGYCTKWGDMAHDFNPIANFTTEEVIAIGEHLGLPDNIIHKAPSDGLCGLTDEEKIGFTYEVLNKYIRTGICDNTEIREKIDKMHENSLHKFTAIPVYEFYS